MDLNTDDASIFDQLTPEEEAEYQRREKRRLKAPPNCGYCGRFVPKKNVYAVEDSWSGARGAAWDCPSCGEYTSTI